MPLWTGQPLAYPTVQKTGAAAYSAATHLPGALVLAPAFGDVLPCVCAIFPVHRADARRGTQKRRRSLELRNPLRLKGLAPSGFERAGVVGVVPRGPPADPTQGWVVGENLDQRDGIGFDGGACRKGDEIVTKIHVLNLSISARKHLEIHPKMAICRLPSLRSRFEIELLVRSTRREFFVSKRRRVRGLIRAF
jgi:hypothetical protein